MAFNLSSAVSNTEKPAAAGIAVGEPVDMLPPIYYETTTQRIEIRDESGALTGYDDVTSGLGYTSTYHYDTDFNYQGSDYVDDSGYRSSTRQTTLRDDAGTIIGYTTSSTGSGSDYAYTSLDEYDANWSLIHSEYSDSQGYSAQTDQTTLLDANGAITGYTIISAGGDASSNYHSEASYDASWNLLVSTYSDSSGYQSSYLQTTLTDVNGKISGYQIVSSGSGGWGSYTSTETLDASRNLLSSEYSDDSGYHSTYAQITEYASDGTVSGYRISTTWTYGDESYSSDNHYDANWNWIDGSDPPMVMDDGPKILPVLTLTDDAHAVTAQADMGAGAETASGNAVTDTPGTNDVLQGSREDDVFVVSDRGDRIDGNGGKGVDSVVTGDFNLKLVGTYAGIENGALLGSDDLSLAGNGKDNTLSGNAGDNWIAGKRGADVLFGGLGADVFLLDKTNLKEADEIVDFTVGTDIIAFTKKGFADLVADDGSFDEDAWGSLLRFDATSGGLIYDTGSGEVTIALIGNIESLDASNFTIH